jgi:hypothetical protein
LAGSKHLSKPTERAPDLSASLTRLILLPYAVRADLGLVERVVLRTRRTVISGASASPIVHDCPVTRRENSGSPCGESWTAQGSRSPIWTSLARWYLLRGLTGRQSNADWSSVWCRPRRRSRSRLLAERVGLTLSPARTWARGSCWTPTPTLVAAQKDEARTTFKGGHGFHSSGLWCVTTPTSWARSIL